jgi:hypothetical protein
MDIPVQPLSQAEERKLKMREAARRYRLKKKKEAEALQLPKPIRGRPRVLTDEERLEHKREARRRYEAKIRAHWMESKKK